MPSSITPGTAIKSTRREKKPVGPQSARPLSTKEKIILLEGSKLNGFTFPPWERPPGREEFELDDPRELYLYVGMSKNPSCNPLETDNSSHMLR